MGCGPGAEEVVLRSGIYQLEHESISDDCDPPTHPSEGRVLAFGGIAETGEAWIRFPYFPHASAVSPGDIEAFPGATLERSNDATRTLASGLACPRVAFDTITVAALDAEYLELEYERRWEVDVSEECVDSYFPRASCTSAFRHIFTLEEGCPSHCVRSLDADLRALTCQCD